jgi:hypothetical protein
MTAFESPGKVDGIFALVRFFQGLVLLLFACAALSFPVSDTDVWWHLAAGREICRIGSFLHEDRFCLSSIGTSWTDLHWGFQVLIWKVWSHSGIPGLVFLRILLPCAAILLALERRISWTTVLAGCIGLWILRSFVDVRPLLVSLLLLVAIQTAIEASPRWGKVRPILVCLGCQVLLTNVQGLFLLGPLLVAAFGVGDWWEGYHGSAMEKFALCAAMLVASLANPYGIHAFELAGRIAARITPSSSNPFSTEIPENAPLWTWIMEEPRRIVPLAWLASAAVLFWRGGPGARGRLLVVTASAILAVAAVRNLPLSCLEIAFCLDTRRSDPVSRVWTISASAVVLALALLAGIQKRWDVGAWSIAPFRLPGESALAKIHASDAPVFHELRAGGWITWKLDVNGRCWADTRLVLHDDRFLSQYLDAVDHPENFPAFARHWNFGFALLPLVEFPRFHPLAQGLLRSPDWVMVDCDGAWALFQKRGLGGIPRPEMSTDSVWSALERRFAASQLLESTARGATLSFFRNSGRDDLVASWPSRP